MASPVDVRVEAIAPTVVTIRWEDADANNVEIYVSLDGIDFTLLDTVLAGVQTYTDEAREPDTKYWFKLSQDSGTSFSATVSVWTQTCLVPSRARLAPRLPRFGGGEVDDQRMNKLAEEVEELLTPEQMDSLDSNCFVCSDDGQLVVDCSGGCDRWTVVVTEDINSISFIGCGDCPEIQFVIPPNATRRICGWPPGCGFDGDECFSSPIEGGDNGVICHSHGECQSAPTRGARVRPCPCPIAGVLLQVICCDEE